MKVLILFGTRPEAIKFAPLIKAFQKEKNAFEMSICVTAQHREMLDQVLAFFDIRPDFDLDIMTHSQSLADLTARILTQTEPVIRKIQPDLIFVQGDTTTAFVGALCGYYTQTKVCHLEAGLRSYDKYSPFPEEINRTLVGHIADYHFAPTATAVRHLKRENIRTNVFQVGNTVIDALLMGLDILKKNPSYIQTPQLKKIDFSKKTILITGHRRESFGKPFEAICDALISLATTFENVQFVYPVHLNPNVQGIVHKRLDRYPNIFLLPPLPYPELIHCLNQCYLVLTDSGGIQEEAPSLGKPVLVMRDVTERTEGIKAGTAKLVGRNPSKIIKEVTRLLTDSAHYQKMAKAKNPYGDGSTSQKIIKILKEVS